MKGGLFQVRAVKVGQAFDPQEVDRPIEAEHVFAGQLKVGAERVEDLLVDAVFDLEADGGPAPEVAAASSSIFFQQIFGLFIVDVEVAVAGDPECMRAFQAVSREQLAGAKLDDFAEENRPLGAGLGWSGSLPGAEGSGVHRENRDPLRARLTRRARGFRSDTTTLSVLFPSWGNGCD